MNGPGPTILALQADSAWVVILAVSLVILPAVAILRRLINRPGGLASGLLLALPLALPLAVAFLYGHPGLPEVAVLRPAIGALLDGSDRAPEQLLLLRDSSGRIVWPYALVATTGPWLLVLGAATSSFMLLRRTLGSLAVRRLTASCRSLDEVGRPDLARATSSLARRAGLKIAPEVLVMPRGNGGAFATGGRRPHVLIADELLQCLDDSELEAAIAHEIAHLKARDVRLILAAGLLRDVVAWNPLAHLAYRSLRADRELEADRYAAALTGRPLAVASSLLKMCELMRSRRVAPLGSAVGFWLSHSRLSRRVKSLLSLADGGGAALTPSHVPFLAAAALAVVLALQVGARMTAQEPALALVWGAPSTSGAEVWTPQHPSRHPGRAPTEKGSRPRSKRALDQSLPPLSALAGLRAASAVSEKHLSRWARTVTWVARQRGLPPVVPLQRRESWEVEPLLAEPAGGLVSVYRVERLAFPGRAPGS